MTPQAEANAAAFRGAVRGLASQGWRRSWGGVGGGCAYRGDKGRCCAVGWLISDQNYSGSLEGQSANRGALLRAVVSSFAQVGLAAPSRRVLRRLQSTHDFVRSGDDLRRGFIELGVELCLPWPSDVPQTGPIEVSQ